jgi:hypothetical protein
MDSPRSVTGKNKDALAELSDCKENVAERSM